ncbi:MAG: hypothetical protein ACF8QF_13195 [Phycisphaerales bacterium]
MRINAASASNPALLRQIERRNATETAQPKPVSEQPAGAKIDSVAVGEAETRQWPGKALGIQKIIDSGRAVPAAPNSRVPAQSLRRRASSARRLRRHAPKPRTPAARWTRRTPCPWKTRSRPVRARSATATPTSLT